MSIDKKQLHKLSPEERIRKLKLMEEERKKEVTEIERLIKESMQELRTDKIAEEFAPEQKPVNISRLFEATGDNLEKMAKQETHPHSAKGAKGYMSAVQIDYDYSNLKKFYGVVSGGGSLSEYEKKLVGEIGERVNIAEKYLPESEKVASKLNASRAILYKMWKETGLG